MEHNAFELPSFVTPYRSLSMPRFFVPFWHSLSFTAHYLLTPVYVAAYMPGGSLLNLQYHGHAIII
jgi:hypothetical protein